jgi:hypothetical protein
METCKTTWKRGHTQQLGGFPAHQNTQITAWIRVSSIRNWNSSPDSSLDLETLSKKILQQRPIAARVFFDDVVGCWKKKVTERIKASLRTPGASRVPMADILPYDPVGDWSDTGRRLHHRSCVDRETLRPVLAFSEPLPTLSSSRTRAQ